ncbi:MAG: tetraacyldisaccharide 4'-kinase [Ignavibacteria bacterium GWB2_35_12]|nr:MAG: tetraacyldisaccharide 4'-kinase [Ignavibacteria bacterium GWA2_35_8]OGU40824.1 MAG: tetraacyldisaccharide 4'-kinase [Ignavibacteria bacterium GWB2_35_12]OGU87116.1 MAG: tetraacyldisaccharide 4'-kinase [Ignavibacteria bacterium RIFOXYA2_FULL_35_10]OGV24651.1 MAG: tetraacyldisaccharide 4'-kinase [Ignavibacteria bacterium RIFOXYC2_FULL_35_21]
MLQLLSKIYGSVVNAKNKSYDNGKAEIVKCSVPVISVGNLTTGGTGKTPFVIFLAIHLLESGIRPVIIGKGYRKKRSGYVLVSDGSFVVNDPDLAGDEMLLIAKKVKVPVVAHESKSDAALIAEKHFSPDLIIIDDGFQHRRLYRDIDILLIDSDTLTNQNLLPAGRLREPLSAASRADVIVEIGEIAQDEIIKKYLINNQKIFKAVITPETLIGSDGKTIDDDEIKKIKKKVIAVSGIANPERFDNTLLLNGYNVLKHIKFRDHKRYTQFDIDAIIKVCKKEGTDKIITTEKDYVKIQKFISIFEKNNIECCVFPIKIELKENQDEFKDDILSKIEGFKGR